MACSTIPLPTLGGCAGPPFRRESIRIKGRSMYRNKRYYGKVIGVEGNTIKVKVKSKNIYMNGQIIELVVLKN